MSEYFQGIDSKGEPITAASPEPNPIPAKKPIFSQKSLSGGGSVKASSPSFANASISRYIAYKNCCPPPCDPYYDLLLRPFPGTTNLVYSSGIFVGGIEYGTRLNTIRPCKTSITFVGFYPSFNSLAIVTNVDDTFNNVIITGPVNLTLSVSSVTYNIVGGGSSTGYRLYYWFNNVPGVPSVEGIYKILLV